MGFKHIAVIALLVPFWAFYPDACIADRIVLKDGTVEESDKIWTSEKFVHFILKGTQFVEIRYAIDIVERVERDRGDAADPSPAPVTPLEKTGEKEQATLRSGFLHNTPNKANQGNSTAELRKIEQGSRGMSFYDPRRALRYQVTKTSAHNELQSALNELAKIYGRTPDWVAAHMGEENDIQIIHQNLIGRRQAEMTSQAADQPEGRLAATGSAVETPATQPIPGAGEPPASDRHYRNRPTDPELMVHRGIKFYDPRRERKYWTAKTKHHNSLQEAVADLALQYSMTPKWIEDHIGDSNLLIDIHQNIRNSLPTE